MNWIVHVIGIISFGFLTGALDEIDPVETITNFTGQAAVAFALFSLSVTTLQRLLKARMFKARRPSGLWAFFFAALHVAMFTIVNLDNFWGNFLKASILVGAICVLIWAALAATSTRWARRKMGKSWVQLHELANVALIFGILHWMMSIKVIGWDAYLAAAILFALLIKKALHSR